MWYNCGPFGEGSMTVANTCAPSVREWYRKRSQAENILRLKYQHNTPIRQLWRENITEHMQVIDLKQREAMQGHV